MSRSFEEATPRQLERLSGLVAVIPDWAVRRGIEWADGRAFAGEFAVERWIEVMEEVYGDNHE